MENLDIAKVFYEIADLLEVKGENPFRIRSYRNAALVVEGYPESFNRLYEKEGEKGLEEAAHAGKLSKLPGMGEKSEEKILKAIEGLRAVSGRFNLSMAVPYAEKL